MFLLGNKRLNEILTLLALNKSLSLPLVTPMIQSSILQVSVLSNSDIASELLSLFYFWLHIKVIPEQNPKSY